MICDGVNLHRLGFRLMHLLHYKNRKATITNKVHFKWKNLLKHAFQEVQPQKMWTFLTLSQLESIPVVVMG